MLAANRPNFLTWLKIVIVVFLVAAASTSVAAPWKFAGNLLLAEQYTDSVRANAANKEASLVTEISPGLSAKRQGARAGVEADYNYHQYLYLMDSPTTSANHTLRGLANIEPVKNHLFLNSSIQLSQSVIDSTQPIPFDGATLSANRTDVWSYGAGARWEQRFGTFGQGKANYNYSGNSYASAAVASASSHSFSGDVSSGSEFRHFRASATAQGHRSGHGNGARLTSASALATAGFVFDADAWYVFIRGGYERNLGLASNSKLASSGISRFAGFEWTPSRKFHASGLYGERPFGRSRDLSVSWKPTQLTSTHASYGNTPYGDTYGAGIAHTMRQGDWSLDYSEQITTLAFLQTQSLSLGQALSLTSLQSNQALALTNNGLFLLTGREGALVNKNAAGRVSVKGGRNTVSLSASRNWHEFKDAGIRDITDSGTGAWSVRLGERTTGNASITRQELKRGDTERSDLSWSTNWALIRQLGKSATFTGSYTYRRTDASIEANNQEQTVLRAQVILSF